MKKIYNEDYYMYRLCNIKGIGRASVRKLVDFFGSAYNVSKADINILKKTGILNGRQIDEFAFSMKNKDNIYKYEDMIKNGCNWISINNNNYPERLHNIDDAPLGLYCRGNLPPDDRLSVAIIGSRNCSSYGRRMAYNLAESFAADNIQVISGLAAGIDAAAHRGCLASGGYTYAVLGCGTDVCYPYENLDIYKNIIKTGGVISEYPPNTRPDAWRFPERNRIISGLADIVIVVEAAQRSGAMITVD